MNQDQEQNSDNTRTFDLDVVGVLRRRFKHIVFGIALGLCIGLLYFYVTPRQYESDMEILVGQRSSEMTASGTANDSYASGATIQEDVLATHMDILTSKKVLLDAISRASLNELYSFRKAKQDSTPAVQHLLDHLKVTRGGEGDANVLAATYRDPRSKDAAVVLSAVYASYHEYVKDQWSNDSDEAAVLLQDAQNKREAELAQADKEYREFISSVPVFVDGDKMSDVHRDRLNKMEEELNEVRSKIAELQSRSEVIAAYADEGNLADLTDIDRLSLLSENEVTRLKLFLEMTRGDFQSEEFVATQPVRVETAKAQYNRLLDLYQKQRNLSEAYGRGHPLVKATMKEIEVIKDFIAKTSPKVTYDESGKKLSATEMLTAYRQLLANDEAALKLREKVLLTSVNRELIAAKGIEADFMKGSALKSKVERAQARYDDVARRLQEINIAGNFAGFSTDLLATAQPTDKACWPKLPLSVAMGLLLGAMLGLTTALIAELADTTFRDAKDLESATGSAILTHVAPFDMPRLRELVDPESKIAPQICAFHGPRSQESEVYRTARTSLLLGCKKYDRRILMMTSPAPGDGKSTTIANLSVSLAQTGKRVLLIDADLRRPMVYNVFGASSSPGVTDIIDETCTLEKAVQESEQENLDLLSHGTRTGSPAEILQSYQFGALLEQARRDYDLVLIDAPPVLAVTDPAIIASQVDGVVMTIQVQKNGRRPVERACEILREINIVPIGLIVNNSGDRTAGYGYSNDYGNAYGYVGKYYDDYSAPDAPVRTRAPRKATVTS